MATATETNPDQRRKVEPDLVLKLRSEGKSAADIAEQGLASNGEKVAVGTIYKILRNAGQGGPSRGSRSGLNVSADITALRERWEKQIASLDETVKAENERHEKALKDIQDNVTKAKSALKQLDAVVKSVTDNSDQS